MRRPKGSSSNAGDATPLIQSALLDGEEDRGSPSPSVERQARGSVSGRVPLLSSPRRGGGAKGDAASPALAVFVAAFDIANHKGRSRHSAGCDARRGRGGWWVSVGGLVWLVTWPALTRGFRSISHADTIRYFANSCSCLLAWSEMTGDGRDVYTPHSSVRVRLYS